MWCQGALGEPGIAKGWGSGEERGKKGDGLSRFNCLFQVGTNDREEKPGKRKGTRD